MINLLEDYIPESLPERGDFTTNPNLLRKTDPTGKFLPFYGNTVVFDLDGETKFALRELQERLYKSAGWMLSGKLDPSTFHMTLHDLVNGPEDAENLRFRMEAAEAKVKPLLECWRGQPELKMKTTWLFNMVNTSIVLGLSPADEETWRRLDGMYMALESVVSLGYAMTPHITMAYFRPGIYTQYDLDHLRQALGPVERNVTLRMEDLFYQEFTDMNHYENR